jgi:hypothetical protein
MPQINFEQNIRREKTAERDIVDELNERALTPDQLADRERRRVLAAVERKDFGPADLEHIGRQYYPEVIDRLFKFKKYAVASTIWEEVRREIKNKPDPATVQTLRQEGLHHWAARFEELMAYDRTIHGMLRQVSRNDKDKLRQLGAKYQMAWTTLIEQSEDFLLRFPLSAERATVEHDYGDWYQEQARKLGLEPRPLERQTPGAIAVPRETDMVEGAVDNYLDQREKIRQLREKFPNDVALFRELFGFEPSGEIEVIDGPVNIHFRCNNLKDYALASDQFFLSRSGKNITGDSEDARNVINAQQYSGGSCATQPRYGIIVTLENNTNGDDFSETRPQAVYRHESRHAANRLFIDIQNEVDEEPSLTTAFQKARAGGSPEALRTAIAALLRDYRREEIDAQAANEILSYTDQGSSADYIWDELTETEERHGLYDYAHAIVQNWQDGLLYLGLSLPADIWQDIKQQKDIVSALIPKIFIDEYQKAIRDGISACMQLKQRFGVKGAIAALSLQPLTTWPKIVKRMEEAPVGENHIE